VELFLFSVWQVVTTAQLFYCWLALSLDIIH
jgi:hypothetical protein